MKTKHDTQIEPIKTFEEACTKLGVEPRNVLPYLKPQNADEENTNAYVQLKVITKALNDGWTPDWNDRDQRKWCPYFEYQKNSSGFGFSYTDFDFWFTYTFVGSRLCFRTEELAEYAGKQFIEIYNKLLMGDPGK